MVNLVTVPGVELMKVGKWNLSTGEWECTPTEIQAAIDAHQADVLRKPVIRLGHNDSRFSGEPAVGYLDNLRSSEDGQTLLGDMVGVPQWLADIMPSAYPSRSIEGLYDYTAPDGSEHEFVMTGLALLGATKPGVESLKSLQDVATLYDTVAAAEKIGGKAIEVMIEAASKADDDGVEPDGDSGSDATKKPFGDVEYADPGYQDDGVSRYPIDTKAHVKAAWAYINKSSDAGKYHPNQLRRIKDRIKAAAKKFGIKIEAATASDTEKEAIVATLEEQLIAAMGLAPNATHDDIVAAAAGRGSKKDDPDEDDDDDAESNADEGEDDDPKPKAKNGKAKVAASGVMQIDAEQYRSLVEAAEAGQEARRLQIAESDDRVVMAAIKEGRIPPARKDHWLGLMRADRDGTKEVLASLAPGLVPVSEMGHAAPEEESAVEADIARVHDRVMASMGLVNKKAGN